MAAVPVADPTRRGGARVRQAAPLHSPIHPVGHAPAPSVYDEVAPGHLVLREVAPPAPAAKAWRSA
jgi:peptide/nickel transport system ATP-binding protein/glutathione transport system ATP-binding protein